MLDRVLDRKALGRRMAQARFDAQTRLGHNLSMQKLGEMVERELRDDVEYSASQIKNYLDGKVGAVTVAFVLAYARACGVQPGWLAFGDERDQGEIPRERVPLPGVPGVRSTSRVAKRRPAG